MVSSAGRAALGAELKAFAEGHVAAMAGYTDVGIEASKGVARYTMFEGNRLTVAKYTAKGLTMDKINQYYTDACANATKMNAKLKVTKIDEVEGCPVFHAEASLPWPMSNRSTIFTQYRTEADGGLCVISSSKGNEALVTAHAKAIGKNVVATQHINAAFFKPVDGGFEVTTVMCADPAGSIPDAMKNKQAARNAQQPFNICNFMLTGAVPTD